MTRKAPAKTAKKPPKPVTVYMAVRTMVSVNESFTEPDRVFASHAAAKEHADRLNRELRNFTNPFGEDRGPEDLIRNGGEDAFVGLLKKLGVAVPKVKKGHAYIDWQAWWDRSYDDLADAQRDAIWDALDEFGWYEVKPTTLEE